MRWLRPVGILFILISPIIILINYFAPAGWIDALPCSIGIVVLFDPCSDHRPVCAPDGRGIVGIVIADVPLGRRCSH